jgi:hypothetical protein
MGSTSFGETLYELKGRRYKCSSSFTNQVPRSLPVRNYFRTAHQAATWSAPRNGRGKVTYTHDQSRVCTQQLKTVRSIKLVRAVMFLSFVWKVTGLNHDWDSSYSVCGWSLLSPISPDKFRYSTLN